VLPTGREEFEMDLQRKVVVVTGGASGIGRASCFAFEREGAAVVIVDVDRECGQRVAQRIRGHGGRAMFIHADVSSEQEVADIVKPVVRAFGGIDVLVNGAGVGHSGTVVEDMPKAWDEVIGVNLRSVYLCSHFLIPELLKRPMAAIVNVGSVQSCAAAPRSAAYVASKFGLLGLTKAMAVDHGPKVRVNAVLPGSVDTALFRSGLPVGSKASMRAIREAERKHILGRIAAAEEVAEVIVFLASGRASFITGAGVLVDGGMTARV
jgi:NAD(P)-dependent dehydrogenase (short-subunit alcohol dehydrogenase family)